jgi:aminopeptidase N
MKVNGTVVGSLYLQDEKNFEKTMIRIDEDLLEVGKNVIEIDFESTYSKSGEGLTYFTEPGTNDNYLFTWFETYGAQSVFPCLDQPDLKGLFSLNIAHPTHWTALSNEKVKFVQPYSNFETTCPGSAQWVKNSFLQFRSNVPEANQSDFSITSFTKTKKICTYIFSINVGDYQTITHSKKHSAKPLSLHCRKSKLPIMKDLAPAIFESVVFGLQFMEKLCGVKYAFSKYDMIFTPPVGLFYSACENPGMVSFKDTLLTPNSRRLLDALQWVTWHEMGHMWYACLVTNTWWGETWLKEAFADFLAIKTAKAFGQHPKGPESSYQSEHSFGCGWQLQADKMINGIMTEINPITERAVKFDLEFALHGNLGYGAYIYGKSCTILNEMFELFGGDAFFTEFTKTVCKEYQWDNLDTNQWIDVINKIPEQLKGLGVSVPDVYDKGDIVQQYFNNQGFDFLTFDFDVETKILKIGQKPGVEREYRSHCLDILFMDSTLEKITKYFVVVSPKAETEILINYSSTNEIHLLPNYSNIG